MAAAQAANAIGGTRVADLKTKKGRGGVASLFAVGLGMRTSAAPCTPTLRLGPGPCVRRLSYELRITRVGDP